MVASKRVRGQKGQAVVLPMVVLSLCVIVALGLFSFEVSRTAIAREQLRSATEAAALAGAATLAGSSDTDISISQGNAINAATGVFKQNEIFGNSLSNAQVGNGQPAVNQTFLEFIFTDRDGNQVPAGDPKGKFMEVRANYGLAPLTGKAIGLGDNATALQAQASGGVGQIDLVFCFDCSLSMKENTLLTTVKRTWNNNTGKIDYIVVSKGSNFIGGMRPENISVNFALRGATNNSFPGNFPPGVAADSGSTDVVVNFDEKPDFTNFSEGGFDFPNVGALVEAARGNLENEAVFESSGAKTALSGIVVPKAGYQAKYLELCRKHSHPWAEAEAAAKEFVRLMGNNANAHFGFVAFDEKVGQDENTKVHDSNVSQSYPAGGETDFPLPAVSLHIQDDPNNQSNIQNVISTIAPLGATNIGGSLERANRMFDNSSSRPNAKRAIVLFTDGIPNVGSPLSGNPEQNCFLAAQQAKSKGIAIYAVGLNLNPQEQAAQNSLLGNITTTAGNGGRFFQVHDTNKLNQAFASIARNLSAITQ